ncbi:hypothetical protein J2755_001973 [Methanohalophilus levihalophilus]|uniref:DUF7261 family protein n=1 Tax=Methanohalophilus levihalophilus TaxID=1431282 RepID=UPI001AE82E73|nr:hypothetical protein [Methanohalophilus levihalophilus]MBP2031025.1 hypothetical protein [Methanohalophilus levihalophilus]
MESLKKDTSGQWILLSGLVIAIMLVVVATLFNQVNITGYYASNAALEFPKEDIRELSTQTRLTTSQAYDKAVIINQSSNQTIEQITTSLIQSYNSQLSTIYASHGKAVDVEVANFTYGPNNSTEIVSIWVDITYDDGTTFYSAEPEIVEVNQ